MEDAAVAELEDRIRAAVAGRRMLRIHGAGTKDFYGESLTGEALTKSYCDILKRYHGAAEGVVAIDDVDCVEWAFIPHFYRNYYVFQYATAVAARSLFAQRAPANAPGAPARCRAVRPRGGARERGP